jgi:membrane-associated PAP2 superfamily phosphatase
MNRPIRPALLVPILLAAGLLFNVAWDLAALDLPLAHAFAGAEGFPLREAWPLSLVLHEGGRCVSWALALALSIGVWWPWSTLGRLELARRFQLAFTPLALVMAPALLKAFSETSCPWDLHEFGGAARLVSHWVFFNGGDGGSGHCFPAGHAAAGFAFIGGYFAFRDDAPALARRWLAGALLAGFTLGIGQQLRGAHFMSHTLWTAWLCGSIAWALDLAVGGLRQRVPWTRERVAC